MARNTKYKNEYLGDLLKKSVVTFSLTGQGNISYINHIRYYYN